MSKKKIIIFVILLLLTIVAAVYYFTLQKGGQEQIRAESRKVEKNNVDFAALPQKFPSNIPIEEGARLTQNYNSTTADGRFQATRAFETKASLDQNLRLYTDFLKADGWKVDGTTNNENYKMVYGSKENTALMITMDHNQANDLKTISIIYTE